MDTLFYKIFKSFDAFAILAVEAKPNMKPKSLFNLNKLYKN